MGDWAPRARDWKGLKGGLLCSYAWWWWWWWLPPSGEMGRLWPLSAPGDGLFLRLAALMMFLARMRWLALESRLLTLGERQRLSLAEETGDVTVAGYWGLEVGWLVWGTMGDWQRVSQGGQTGELAVDVKRGLELVEEGSWLVWRLGDQVPPLGPSGLLKRLVNWGVLVGVGVWVGVGVAGDSFLAWGSMPAFLAEKVGRGAWAPDRGEATRSGEKADTGEVILGCCLERGAPP